MEIERKYLVKKLPSNLASYPSKEIAQAYLCTEPVLRIRQLDKDYILTYKSKGLMVREEHEFPLTKESFEHLLKKADGNVISKIRYYIKTADGLTIEFDRFTRDYEGLLLAEVEFPSEEMANTYQAPDWFSIDVTTDGRFHNSFLSNASKEEIDELKKLCASCLEA